MKQSTVKVITKYNNHFNIQQDNIVTQYSFTLFRRFINYYVSPFHSRYGLLQGFVPLETYGLIVAQHLNLDGDIKVNEVDLGSMSCRMYEVNALLHQLCRLKHIDPDIIEKLILSESVSWRYQNNGNPFDKMAEITLLKKLKREIPVVELRQVDESLKQRVQLWMLRQQFNKLE